MEYKHIIFRGQQIRISPDTPPQMKVGNKWKNLPTTPQTYLLTDSERFTFKQGRLWRGNPRDAIYEMQMTGDVNHFVEGGTFKIDDCWYEVKSIRMRRANTLKQPGFIRCHVKRIVTFNSDGSREYEVENVRRTKSGKCSPSKSHASSNGTKKRKRRRKTKVSK